MKKNITPALLLILVAIVSRLVPHPPNFTTVTASSLTAGKHIKGWWKYAIPIGSLLVTDAIIGFYDWKILASVYISFVLITTLGYFSKARTSLPWILGTAFFSSALFFIVTNTAVWAFGSWYPKTIFGLWECYLVALPFFRYMFIGDLLFTPLFSLGFRYYEKSQVQENPTPLPQYARGVLSSVDESR